MCNGSPDRRSASHDYNFGCDAPQVGSVGSCSPAGARTKGGPAAGDDSDVVLSSLVSSMTAAAMARWE
jgi:hypothetical protein